MTAPATAAPRLASAAFAARLEDVLRRGAPAVIAEIKPRSPAEGDLLRGRSVERIADEYAAGGAACLSVVTGARFGGSLALLERVAARTSLPVLRKDLVVTPAEVARSHDAGASAVLLTAGLLAPRRLAALVAEARRLGLAALVEVTSECELDDALAAAPPLVAVNHKGIARWEAGAPDFARAARLRAAGGARGGMLWVAASGISSSRRARWLGDLGYDALLVGTALLRAPSAERALRRLVAAARRPEPAPTRPAGARGAER